MQILATFNQKQRSPQPSHAELHLLSDCIRTQRHASRFLPGATYTTRTYHCPSCGHLLPSDDELHGMRLRCDCGLYMECWGNGLYLWRVEAEGQRSLPSIVEAKAIEGIR